MQVCRRPTAAWIRLGVCPLALALLAACAPGSDLPHAAPYESTEYRLGVGDQVRIITYGEDQLTDDFRVGHNGALAMPLLGDVQAEGLTADQLAASIAKILRDKNLFRAASVSVEVTAYRPVDVLGEVARPGEFPYRPRMTMLAAVAAAGGYTYRAIQGYAGVIRQEGDRSVQEKLLPQDYVAPGDVIKIYERTF
jgi:polysaccharide export outer membrane protein